MDEKDKTKQVDRRDFLRYVATGAAVAVSVGSGANALGALPPMTSAVTSAHAKPRPRHARQPNVIILIDDQNPAGLTKRSGFLFDTMPTMDHLASKGTVFKKAYCTMPACMPSRTSIFTGRWPNATRVRSNFMADDAFFDKDVFDVAWEQGYKTAMVGKDDTYLKPDKVDFSSLFHHFSGPKNHGDRAELKKYERWLDSLNSNESMVPTPFPLEDQFCYRIATDAMRFIDEVGAEPFFMQVSFLEPHDPEQVPKPYWDMFPPSKIPKPYPGLNMLRTRGYRAEWLHKLEITGFPKLNKLWARYLSNYYGALRMVDDQVKRLVGHLHTRGLLDNTIFVRISDHGDYLMKFGLARKGVGLPETLIHVPMFWSGPGIKQNQHVGDNCFVSLADVMPTICEIMGAPIPHGVQGRSLLPLLQGDNYPSIEFRSVYSEAGLGGLYYDREDKVPVSISIKKGLVHGIRWDELNKVTQSGYQRMVRMDHWKLIYDMMGYGQLYDLKEDPDETHNLFNKPSFAKEQAALMAELLMWTIRNTDSLPTGPQSKKYRTKWSKIHNWFAPYRHGTPPIAFIP